MIASKPKEETEEKSNKARDTVADLERRLAMIGNNTAEEPAPAFATPPPVTTTSSNDSSSVKGGKNALLVRFDKKRLYVLVCVVKIKWTRS